MKGKYNQFGIDTSQKSINDFDRWVRLNKRMLFRINSNGFNLCSRGFPPLTDKTVEVSGTTRETKLTLLGKKK